MPRILHMLHRNELHEMPDVKAVRRRVEPDIEGYALLAELFVEFFLVHGLLDKSPRAQGVHHVLHCCLLLARP